MSNKIVPAALAMAVAGGVLLGGCGAVRQRPFEPVFGTGVGPLVTRPGGEFGYLFGLIKNRSHTTVTIDSVSLRGPGVGTVITLPDVRLAPIGAGLSIEQSNYVTDPPITSTGPRGCCKQALKPWLATGCSLARACGSGWSSAPGNRADGTSPDR